MNTVAKIITGVSITAVLGAGSYFYYAYDEVRELVNPVIGVPEAVQPVETFHNACFVIFDPSGSGASSYLVPRLDSEYIASVIAEIRNAGDGEVWVTYIDKESMNNPVLYFQVSEKLQKPVEPVRHGGEAMRVFSERYAQYEADLEKYDKAFHNHETAYQDRLKDFLDECEGMITQAYAPILKSEDWSDVIGSLNTAVRTFKTVPADSVNIRSVLLLSDGVQSLPKGKSSKTLETIPADIQVIIVNSGGSPHVLDNRATEVENLERALKLAIKTE